MTKYGRNRRFDSESLFYHEQSCILCIRLNRIDAMAVERDVMEKKLNRPLTYRQVAALNKKGKSRKKSNNV
jgi:hypothetical protein